MEPPEQALHGLCGFSSARQTNLGTVCVNSCSFQLWQGHSDSFHEAEACPSENGLQPPPLAHKLLSNHLMVTGDTPQVWAGDPGVTRLPLSVRIPEAFRALIRGEVLI